MPQAERKDNFGRRKNKTIRNGWSSETSEKECQRITSEIRLDVSWSIFIKIMEKHLCRTRMSRDVVDSVIYLSYNCFVSSVLNICNQMGHSNVACVVFFVFLCSVV